MLVELFDLIYLLAFTISLLLLMLSILDIYLYTKNDKALIKCPDCNKKVSINAKICPHCNSEILKDKEYVKEKVDDKNNVSNYKKVKYLLIIYQLILGIGIVFCFERSNSFFAELLMLLSLITNTISLLVFMITKNKFRKESGIRFSFIYIPAIILGCLFSVLYIVSIINNTEQGYENDIKEILYSGYTKEEAKILLDNIYDALSYDTHKCINLYGFTKRDNGHYMMNIKETCLNMYLPENNTMLILDENDKTKVDSIYWDFNDDIRIFFYKDGKKVKEYEYIYLTSIYTVGLKEEIKERFEQDVKEKLKSPSSAIFTYNKYYYNKDTNRFFYKGWVEGQNSFGAMVKEDFTITLIPCEKNSCKNIGMDYTWTFN